jgi:hypothetical protein
MTAPDKPGIIVAVGTTCDEIAGLLPYAHLLAKAWDRRVRLLGWVGVAEGESLSMGARPAQRLRQELEELAQGLDVQTAVRVAHRPWDET